MQSQIVDILLIEDGATPSRAMRPCFEAAATPHQLTCVHTAEEALRRLRTRHQELQTRPDLIIVNLDDGERICSLVQSLKSDEATRSTPIIAVTARDDEEKLRRLYEQHANCCVVTTSNERMEQVAGAIEQFWLSVAQLPPGG